MHRKLSIGILVALVLLSPAAALADGDIYAGGPYGTKITSVPYTINAPGAYYLGGNLTYAGNSNGITVNADNVTLDLMGFTLAYTGSSIDNQGIFIWGRNNVEIRNGTVRGWPYGINDSTSMWPRQVGNRVINIRVEQCRTGVCLMGNGLLIQGCTVLGGSSFALQLENGIIRGCLVKNCDQGIYAGLGNAVISGNVLVGNGAAYGYGIVGGGGLVMGNEVSNFQIGIQTQGPGSVIGNTVNTASSSQTGIFVYRPSDPTLLDQNTVTGPGTHYSNTSSAQWRNNGG
jgi:hypothetical protein